jgi:hypothetical protein
LGLLFNVSSVFSFEFYLLFISTFSLRFSMLCWLCLVFCRLVSGFENDVAMFESLKCAFVRYSNSIQRCGT